MAFSKKPTRPKKSKLDREFDEARRDLEYINGKQKYGVKIDWDMIRREYKKLGIPKDTYYPLKADVSKVGYVIDISDRSRGKTTNKLIVALLLYKHYGIQLQYVRCKKSEIEKKALKDLYEVVLAYDYINKIFDGHWNSIFYYGKRWYLCHVDENGEIDRKALSHCTFCCGLDESDLLKSSYNAPLGDMIFFDEFIETVYGYDDFIRFSDICKTIIRDRLSPVIFMSSNNINRTSQWFSEFNIQKDIDTLRQGTYKYIESDLGTHFYVELLEPDVSEHREEVNKRFWGFRNDRLASITGRGEWATDTYQHIPAGEAEELLNTVFIFYAGQYVKLKLVNHEELGECVFVTPATRIHSDSVILTCEERTDSRYVFMIGREYPVLKYMWDLYRQNRFYYLTNADGQFVVNYLKYCKTVEAKRV